MAATKKIRVDRTYSTDNDTEDKGAASLVEKARQLNTSRTINGVGFNGTANISFGTDSVSEGSNNLYHTTARARGAVSAGTGISYNSSTGVISVSNGVYTTDTGTVTNTMLAGSIANAKLANSSITINGTATALGGSISVGTVTSVAAGSYLTGGTITGTGTLAVDATNLNTASKVVARDASGNFSAGTITATLSGTATGLAGTPNITVGTITSGAIAATGAITATGDITAYFSDLRLKTNIVPIADALAKVEALNGVEFDPNETALGLGVDNKHQIGVIAQEVEAVAPELVVDSAIAGYKTVKYDKLTALLIEAVKELSAKVKTLEAQLGGSAPQL